MPVEDNWVWLDWIRLDWNGLENCHDISNWRDQEILCEEFANFSRILCLMWLGGGFVIVSELISGTFFHFYASTLQTVATTGGFGWKTFACCHLRFPRFPPRLVLFHLIDSFYGPLVDLMKPWIFMPPLIYGHIRDVCFPFDKRGLI